MEISPIDLALLETVRELAGTLDVVRGTAVVADFDAHHEAMFTRMFDPAERAAEEKRRWLRRNRR